MTEKRDEVFLVALMLKWHIIQSLIRRCQTQKTSAIISKYSYQVRSSDPGCKGPLLDIFYNSPICYIYQITYQHNDHQQKLTYKKVKCCLLTLFTFSTILIITMIKLKITQTLNIKFKNLVDLQFVFEITLALI